MQCPSRLPFRCVHFAIIILMLMYRPQELWGQQQLAICQFWGFLSKKNNFFLKIFTSAVFLFFFLHLNLVQLCTGVLCCNEQRWGDPAFSPVVQFCVVQSLKAFARGEGGRREGVRTAHLSACVKGLEIPEAEKVWRRRREGGERLRPTHGQHHGEGEKAEAVKAKVSIFLTSTSWPSMSHPFRKI